MTVPERATTVESARDEAIPKPIRVFAEMRSEDVFGSLAFDGVPKSVEEMDAGVRAEARRRHAPDRHP